MGGLVEEGRHLANTNQAHDFISFPLKTRARIYEKCTPLYDEGLSLRDISERTGIAKSTIRDAFKEHQYQARTNNQTLKGKKNGKNFKCGGIPPYGFVYLDGQLIVDPKETLIVRKILKWWQQEKSLRAIARELNCQRIPTRSGKSWYVSMVKRVIDTNKNKKEN